MLRKIVFRCFPFVFLTGSLLLVGCGTLPLPNNDTSVGASRPLGDFENSGFVVEVNAGDGINPSSVVLNDVNGNIIPPGTAISEHAVSDSELKGLGIELLQLYRNVVSADAYQACPNDCPYFKFSDYPGHKPLQVKLAFKSASVLDFTAQNTALASETFSNSSSVPATYTTSLSVAKTNSSTTSWSNSNSFTFSQAIKYKIGFLGTGGGGSTGLSYNHTWGEGGSETSSTTIGTTSGVQVTLQPNQNVIATLSATQGTMKVRVTYEASISGGEVSVWYIDRQAQQVYQSFDNYVGLANYFGYPTKILITQDMDIGFYSGGKIEIKNSNGQVISSSPVRP